MNVTGVIAEFNPFHNGHKRLLEAARENGAEAIVCVMSGNFVQRGSPAIAEKRVRARAALECGADLVAELPLACCTATAQRFAGGGVFLLGAMGCVDTLAFGSECGDVSALKRLAAAVDEPRVTDYMREILKEGHTFAKARQLAVAKVYGENAAALLGTPNNVLAVEYLRQIALTGLKLNAFTVPRAGVEHDSEHPKNGFASASFLREHVKDKALMAENVPKAALKVYEKAAEAGLMPHDAAKLETAVLAHLRRLKPEELRLLPDVSEGLENRLYDAIRSAATLNGLEKQLKTKRYTMARVRRLVLSAFLGLSAEDHNTQPVYIRVLGFTEKGRELLPKIKKHGRLPLSTSLAPLHKLGNAYSRAADLEELATDLYSLGLPKPLPCGYEYTAPIVKPENSKARE